MTGIRIRVNTPDERDQALATLEALAPELRWGGTGPAREKPTEFLPQSRFPYFIEAEQGLLCWSADAEVDSRPWPELTVPELRAALGLDKPAEPASWPGPYLGEYETEIFADGSIKAGCEVFAAEDVRALIAAYQQRSTAGQPAREPRLAVPLRLGGKGVDVRLFDRHDQEILWCSLDGKEQRVFKELVDHYNATTKGE